MLVEKACNNKCYLPAKLYPNDFNEKSVLIICTSRGDVNNDSTVEEKQEAKKHKSGQKVFKFISKMMFALI
jgi:hypothetical protein